MQALLKRQELAAGDFFVRIGDQNHRVGYVVEGLIASTYLLADGERFNFNLSPANYFAFSYAAAVEGNSANMECRALEKTTLLTFDFAEFEQICKSSTAWKEFRWRMAERITVLWERRIFEMLTMNAAQRLENFGQQHPDLIKRLAKYELASYIGITPESLSRLLKTMHKPI